MGTDVWRRPPVLRRIAVTRRLMQPFADALSTPNACPESDLVLTRL